jgi:hypothetical protein
MAKLTDATTRAKKVSDAVPTYAHSSYLLNKSTSFFNTKTKCWLRDTYYFYAMC